MVSENHDVDLNNILLLNEWMLEIAIDMLFLLCKIVYTIRVDSRDL